MLSIEEINLLEGQNKGLIQLKKNLLAENRKLENELKVMAEAFDNSTQLNDELRKEMQNRCDICDLVNQNVNQDFEIDKLKEENSKLRRINCNNQNVLLGMKQIVALKDKVIELMAETNVRDTMCGNGNKEMVINYYTQQAKELMKGGE